MLPRPPFTSSLEPRNETLLGNGVTVDVMSEGEVVWESGALGGWRLYKRRRDTGTETQRRHLAMGAEIAVVHPQGQEHPQRWTNDLAVDLGQVTSLLGADIPRDSRHSRPALMLQDLSSGVGWALEGGRVGSNPGSAPHQLGDPRHPCNLSTSRSPQLRNGITGLLPRRPGERSECMAQRRHREPRRGSCLIPHPRQARLPARASGLHLTGN